MILVISSPKVYAAERLKQEAKKQGVAMEVLSAAELAKRKFTVDISAYDLLYVRDPYVLGGAEFLPQVIALAQKFRAQGKPVVDAVITQGYLGNGKWHDYQKLSRSHIPIPKVFLLDAKSPVLRAKSRVVKWIYGFRGRHVHLVTSKQQMALLLQQYPAKQLMLQEFIPAEYEYKVLTVGYKALPVILRLKIKKSGKPDFGKTTAIKLSSATPKTLKLKALAEKSSKVLRRELAKVDILEAKGKFYVLEVNRFPGLKSFETLTKFNAAGEFVRYLKRLS